jgi:hypothetical protein
MSPDRAQDTKSPISYHSNPCRVLCGPYSVVSAFQSLGLTCWLETCGVNVLFC